MALHNWTKKITFSLPPIYFAKNLPIRNSVERILRSRLKLIQNAKYFSAVIEKVFAILLKVKDSALYYYLILHEQYRNLDSVASPDKINKFVRGF